jgi:hypothetical protein
MIEALLVMISGLASVFPVSFLMYAISERMIARHESRVGKQVGWVGFIWQTWVDARMELRTQTEPGTWLLYLFQLSMVFLLGIRVEYLMFIYIALIGFLLVWMSLGTQSVVSRIRADGQQVRFSIAGAIALLCLFVCFTCSRTTDMSGVVWSPVLLAFVIPFQLCGMILFGEHPFRGMSEKSGWLPSARFYVWSLLTAKLFLGGGEWFFDIHFKAAVLYLGSRIFGIYFPGFHQKDLLRISIIYLFPITGALWLMAMLWFGVIGGGPHV